MSGTSQGPTPAADPNRPTITESEITDPPCTGRADLPPPPSYRSVFAAAPLGMAVVGRDGRVISANGTLADLLGRAPDTLVGAVAADLVDLSSDARAWHAYRDLLSGRQGRLRCTRRLKHPEGHSLWAQVSVAPLPPTTVPPTASTTHTTRTTDTTRTADTIRTACCSRSPTSAPAMNSRPGSGTCRCTTR